MNLKTFTLALVSSFGVPWLTMVVIPFGKMRDLEPVYFTAEADGKDEVYVPRRAGRVSTGVEVYAANGCYVCHTQLIRPSFAGSELGRPGWAGFQGPNPEGVPVDTRRETTPYDFEGEEYAHIGLMRLGPDLSNVGNRIQRYVNEENPLVDTPENWLYLHLYDARKKIRTYWSTCPSMRHLFKKEKVYGQGSPDAVPGVGEDGYQILPTSEARALVSYVLSLKKDDDVPYAIDFSPDKEIAE